MWPAQRFVRQVLQVLHEGLVSVVKAWAHGEESLFRKRGKSQMGSKVHENIMKGYMCQVESTRLEAVHPLSKHQTVENGQVALHY